MTSTNVENNIVRMQFDNAQFEKNVSKTMTTIDKLKEALHFKDSAKGFDNLTNAMSAIKFNPLLDGIQQVHNKFTLLDSFTINMFNRITNAAIDAGKKITSALTIDPIKTGFSEYEQKINAIQVIAANTGALNSGMESAGESVSQTMQALHDIWAGRLGNGQYRYDILDAMGLNHENVQAHVNDMAYGGKTYKDIENALVSGGGGTSVKHIEEVLDDLNHYADKTIYNFTQMTQAIGQFTTAGIDVDTAATSVKGIANLAAYVGAPASDASRAMFQLSQALSTGRVRLQDWMSLEHTAGMGGKIFQDALIDTAEHFGIAAQAAIDAEGSFRESLKHDWLTTDVLNETLKKLSGDFDELYWAEQGYTQSEIQSIMDLGRVATESATKVRTVSMMWDAMKEAAQSTWTETWEYIIGGYEDAPKLLSAINDAISEILGNMNASRNAALKFWYNAKVGGRSDWFRIEEHKERVKEYVEVLDEAGNIKKEFENSVTKDENGLLWMDGKLLEDGVLERWKKAVGKDGKELKDAQGNAIYEYETVKQNAGIIVDMWHYILELAEPIKKAFEDTFDTGLREALYNLTVFMKKLATGLVNSRKPIEELYNTFRGIFSIIKIVAHTVKSTATLFWNIVKRIIPSASTGLLGLTGMLGKFLSTAGGLDKILDVIDSVFASLDNTVGAFIGDTLFNLVSIINDLVFKLFSADGAMEKATNIASGFFKVLELGQHILMAIGGIGFALIDKLFPKLADALFGTASSIGAMAGSSDILDTMIVGIDSFASIAIDWINNLDENLKALVDTFVSFVKETTGIDLVAVWDFLVEKATDLWNILKEINWQVIFAPFVVAYQIFRDGVAAAETLPDKIKAIKDSITGFFDTLGTKFGEAGGKIKEFFDGFKNDAESGIAGAMPIVDGKLGEFGQKIAEFLASIGITDAQSAAKLGAFIAAVAGLLKIIIDIGKTTGGIADVVDSFSGMFDGFNDILENTGDAIEAFTKSLQANSIFKIAAAIGILTLSIIALAFIPEEKLEHALSMMISMFAGLFMILKQLTGLMSGLVGFTAGAGGGIGLGVMMAGLGFAILEITASMAVMASLDPEKLGSALASMYVIGLILKTIVSSFVGIAPGALKGVGSTMLSLAATVWIISKVMESLLATMNASPENPDGVLVAASIVGGIMVALYLMMQAMAKIALIPSLNFTQIGTTLILVGIAVAILGAVMIGIAKALNELTTTIGDPGEAIKAFVAAVGVMTYVTALMAGILIVLSKFPIAVISGVAGSVLVITMCIGALANMVVGITKFAETLGENGMSKLKESAKLVAMLSAIIVGIYALVVVINRMTGSAGSIKALIMLGGIVGAISALAGIVAMLALIPEENLYRAMAALEAISLAVGVLTVVTGTMVAIAGPYLPAIADGLLSLAVSFLAFAAAGTLFAAAIWLIVDAVRNGWEFIQDFSVNGSQVMDDFASQLYNSTESIGRVLVISIPEIMKYVLAGIVTALDTIASYVPIIGFKLTQILLQIFANACLTLAGSAAVLIRGLVWIVEAIDQEIQPLIDACLALIVHVVNGCGEWLAEHSEETADAIMMFVIGVLLVIGQTFRKLGAFLYEVFQPVIDFIVGWFNYLVDWWAGIWARNERDRDKMVNGILDFFTGLGNGIINVWNNIVTFFKNIWNTIKTAFDNLLDKTTHFIAEIGLKIYHFRDNMQKVKDKIIEWVDELKRLPEKFVDSGKNIVGGVVKGILNKFGIADTTIIGFGQRLINLFSGPKGIDAHSPSRIFELLGQYIPEGVSLGIQNGESDSLNAMADYAGDLTGTFGDTMSTGLGSLFADNNLINGSMDLSGLGSSMGEGFGTGIQNGFASMIGGTGLATMATLTPVVNGDNLSMDNILDQYLGSGYGQFNLNGNVTGIDGLNKFSANIQNSIDDSKIMQEIKNEIGMLRGEVNMFNQGVAGHVKAILDEMDKDVYIAPDKLVGAIGDEMYDYISVTANNEVRSGG